MTTKIPVELSSTPGIVDSSNATAITIDSSEHVGIGTASMDGDLHVMEGSAGSVTANGGANIAIFEGSGNKGISILTPDANSAAIFFGSPSDAVGARITWSYDDNLMAIGPDKSGASFRFNSGDGAERARIISTGQIGVGLTAPASNGGANAGLIHLHGGSADWSILHCTTPTSGSGTADGVLIGMISDDVYIFSYETGTNILFGVGNATVGKFASNGNFFTNDGNTSSLSDKRIKKNITPVAEGLDVVKKLNPINFEYCNTYEGQQEDGLGMDDGRIHKGFIADEVQEVAPSYVEETTGVVLNEEVDDLKTLSMTSMIPMLVKAIQELSAKVEELESKIDG